MVKRVFSKFILVFLWVTCAVHAHQDWHQVPDTVDSIHGRVELQEAVIKELCASPIMQRLKNIHQYGAYNISHPLPTGKTYTRYNHSLGVMKMVQLAREKGAKITLGQIIAALLHDCSHTVFSHATDPLFMGGFRNGNYQDKIHAYFLKKHGILEIVKKYGFSLEDILPDNPQYVALEQSSPNICADRLEYNLYSGYLTGLLSDADRQAILDDLHFENNHWYFTKPELALKLARVSLYDTLYTWGSPSSLLTSLYASKALKLLVDQKVITLEDIQYNKNDSEVWQIMVNSKIPEVQKCVKSIINVDKTFKLVQEGEHDMILKGRFSGIDPFIQIKGKMVKLTEHNASYGEEFNRIKKFKERGWPIKFIHLNEYKK